MCTVSNNQDTVKDLLLFSSQLPEILKTLIFLQIENEMPCFDPKDVIFVTNKWDTIVNEDDNDDSSDDESTKTWQELKRDIKENWSLVKEDNIFRLNLVEVILLVDN